MCQNNVTGLILAGGASRRFGRDKAHYPVEGRPMIGRVYEVVQPLVAEVLVSVRSPVAPSGVAARPVYDRRPGLGPLAGLHAGLVESRTLWVLVLACDMPFLSPEVLRMLIAARRDTRQAVLARTPDGRMQPLCALYQVSILPHVECALASGELSLHALLDRLAAVEIDVPQEPLQNVNRPEDLPSLVVSYDP